MAQTSFKDEFTLTKDNSLISLNVTSGEQCFWPAKHTSMYPVLGTTQKFMIGGNPSDLIQLDFTKSTNPGVTAGSIRADYINTLHDLVLYNDVVTISGIVGITERGSVLGITTSDTLDIVGDIAMNSVIAVNQPALILRTGDFGLDVSRGLYTGITMVQVSGLVPKLAGNNSGDLWWYGETFHLDHFWLSSAALLRNDGHSNEDHWNGGDGARELIIEGLDANCNFITDTIQTVGSSQTSSSSNSYLRVNKSYVSKVGTYHGSNYSVNDIFRFGSSDKLSRIGGGYLYGGDPYGAGVGWDGKYSVPAGKTAYIMSCYFQSRGDAMANVSIWKVENIDDNSSPYSPRHCVFQSAIIGYSGIDDENNYSGPRHVFEFPIRIPEKSDVWMRASNRTGSDSEVSGHMVLIVVDN